MSTADIAQSNPPTSRSAAARARAGGVLLLAMIVSALLYYKWGGSLRTLSAVHDTGKLAVSPGMILNGGVFATTLAYFTKIWPALVYGILIGAAVRAAIPASWVRRQLGARGARPTVAGALAGAPLMLCSCCITPVFTGLHQRGARLGPSLAVMLASPGLNLAAIVLTFALLPTRVGLVRLAAALVIVLGLSAVVGRAFDADVRASDAAACDTEAEERATLGDRALHFVKSIGYLVVVTVPLIVAGVALSGLLLPHVTELSRTGVVVAVVVVALVGTLAALPTFFEIPIAVTLLSMGAPLPVVVAFVVAGPVVNLPSLLVVGRETRPRVAVALALGVWALATASGLAAMV
jgi:uncharacterized membrane protein YraQ (UPF0718 family)